MAVLVDFKRTIKKVQVLHCKKKKKEYNKPHAYTITHTYHIYNLQDAYGRILNIIIYIRVFICAYMRTYQ